MNLHTIEWILIFLTLGVVGLAGRAIVLSFACKKVFDRLKKVQEGDALCLNDTVWHAGHLLYRMDPSGSIFSHLTLQADDSTATAQLVYHTQTSCPEKVELWQELQRNFIPEMRDTTELIYEGLVYKYVETVKRIYIDAKGSIGVAYIFDRYVCGKKMLAVVHHSYGTMTAYKVQTIPTKSIVIYTQ